jgi:hypothetical protein
MNFMLQRIKELFSLQMIALYSKVITTEIFSLFFVFCNQLE